MLKLRTDQFELFERRMFAVFQSRLERAIAQAFPELSAESDAAGADRAAPVEGVSEIVERGIERAVDFDLQEAADMAAFIALFLSLRLTPARSPTDWIRAWLERPDSTGAARLALVEFELDQRAAADPALRHALERIARAREACRHGAA